MGLYAQIHYRLRLQLLVSIFNSTTTPHVKCHSSLASRLHRPCNSAAKLLHVPLSTLVVLIHVSGPVLKLYKGTLNFLRLPHPLFVVDYHCLVERGVFLAPSMLLHTVGRLCPTSEKKALRHASEMLFALRAIHGKFAHVPQVLAEHRGRPAAPSTYGPLK